MQIYRAFCQKYVKNEMNILKKVGLYEKIK